MAQADIHHTTPSAHLETATRVFAIASDISDIKAMSRLAEITVQAVVGETTFRPDGEVENHLLTVETADRVIFVVTHLAEMIEAFERKFSGADQRHTEH